jgi:hypothetical protein
VLIIAMAEELILTTSAVEKTASWAELNAAN